jgi:hypothetical protein
MGLVCVWRRKAEVTLPAITSAVNYSLGYAASESYPLQQVTASGIPGNCRSKLIVNNRFNVSVAKPGQHRDVIS